MRRILIVDDDKNLRYSFSTLMRKEGYEVEEASDGPPAIRMVEEAHYDAIIMDIRMPRMSGLEAISLIHERHPRLPVIIATAYGTTETAIEAMRLGAYDYVLKPFDINELKLVIASAVEDSSLMRDLVHLPDEPPGDAGELRIIGSSAAMQEVYKLIGKVSRSDIATVLITGPTGCGKELVGRAIYTYSTRRDKPFQAVNCAALPDNLLESELFGHEKGAFTGAIKTKLGRFERCHGGTIFLDEIGDMSLLTQTKILRVLQEKSFERLGGTETITVDVRVIAATNKNLEKLIEGGGFREDLFYRLSVVHITIPPLNKRPSDIPELINYFIQKYNRDRQQPLEGITDRAHAFLAAQPWPGNVRELENAIQRAMVLCPGQVLRTEDFSFLQSPDSVIARPAGDDIENLAERLLQQARKKPGMQLVPEMERLLIETALRETGGNQVKAARLLGISRNTLRNRIEKFGLKGKED